MSQQQVQCPNCGGYKVVQQDSYYQDPETHERLRVNAFNVIIPPLGILALGFILGIATLDTPNQAGLAWITGSIMIAFVAWLILRAVRLAHLKQSALFIRQSECWICGKRFEDRIATTVMG